MVTDSKTHPKHYLMHKYWGRKSHSFISDYIRAYTKKGETVLDPFMGSGVVIIEANKLQRSAIGIDLNPMSVFICDNSLSLIDADKARDAFNKLVGAIPAEIYDLETTLCPVCGKKSKLVNCVWDNGNLARVKGYCEEHKSFNKDSDDFDIKQYEISTRLLKRYDSEGYFYPKDKILDYVKRSGVTTLDKLYSTRNLLICSVIYHEIVKVKDRDIRGVLLMSFTSMLPNVSAMIPGDLKTVQGKSGWQISKFWVPKVHTEKNVFDSFNTRFTKVLNGKVEIMPLLSNSSHKLYNHNSEEIKFVDSNTIDYIFTDPPYGESIAYFGLSMFWNAWLKHEVNYESEIIYDPYRKKGYEDYSNRLTNAYKEMYRVLKPGKTLSFTFHNRSLKFWKIIIDACLESGFELKSISWQPQAVNSGTQGINRKNTLYGDFVYNFVKPIEIRKRPVLAHSDPEKLIKNTVDNLFKKYDFLETSKIYEILVPKIVKQNAFEYSDGRVLDIDSILIKLYKPKNLILEGKTRYGWEK